MLVCSALATGNCNVDSAMEWVLSHLDDPDFNEPLPAAAAAAAGPATTTATAATAAAHDPEKVSSD
jgi:ubiquitin carboxyl-terminal hydrolase 5/13